MTNTPDLSQQGINTLLDVMGEELASHGSEFTFTQLRVSAEHFIVPLCGLAIERVINTSKPDR